MASPFEKQTQSFLQGGGAKMLKEKQAQLENLSHSPDGQKVKQALDKDGRLEKAVADGDTAAMQSVLSNLLQTQEGKRLAQKLQELMK